MRGVALSVIRAKLKAELRDAQETNTLTDTEYNYAIDSKQRDLCLAYDWEFLKHDWNLSCTSGTRYFNIPTTDTRSATNTINFERPVSVNVLWGTLWVPVCYGIGPDEYSVYEGTTRTADPILRWRMSTDTSEAANADQIEVWPVPNAIQTLRFSGQRDSITLDSDADKADLDDLLLVYWVAADYLAMRGQPNAPLVLKKAVDHLTKLRTGYPTRECPPVHLGYKRKFEPQGAVYIAVK